MFHMLIDLATEVVSKLGNHFTFTPRQRVARLRECPTVLAPHTTYIYMDNDNVVVKCVGEKGTGCTEYTYGPGSLVTLYAPMPVHVDLTVSRQYLLPDATQIKDHVYVYMIEDRVWATTNCGSISIG